MPHAVPAFRVNEAQRARVPRKDIAAGLIAPAALF
jgi:hypothetical protein